MSLGGYSRWISHLKIIWAHNLLKFPMLFANKVLNESKLVSYSALQRQKAATFQRAELRTMTVLVVQPEEQISQS